MGVATYSIARGRFLPEYRSDFDAILPNPASPAGIAFFDDAMLPLLRKRAEVVHRHGAACVGQLHNLGAARNTENFQPAVAPSAVVDDYEREVPHELEPDDIEQIVEAFAHGVRRLKEAGLDGAELHGAHGYLIHQFLSPFTNRRTDRYGGSLENRLRFVREIIDASRQLVGDSFPIGLRINGDEFLPGGLTADDVRDICVQLSSRLAFINVAGGSFTGLKDGLRLPYVAPWLIEPGPMLAAAALIKRSVGIPVIVAGRINDPALAERILADGSADMVGMARAFIADPQFANKARAGEPFRKCIANNECHVPGRPLVCAINSAAGREDELRVEPALRIQRILVIGGGPAGMEAARIAAQRGHSVVLCEKELQLGGQLRVIAQDPARRSLGDYVEDVGRELARAGVEIRLATEASASLVASVQADVVIVATGSRPWIPPVAGASDARVVTALDVLRGTVNVGQHVLVVGELEDHLPPPTVAAFLAAQGKQVEVIAEPMVVGAGIEPSTLHLLTRRLLELGVVLSPLTALGRIDADSITVTNVFTGQERYVRGIDTVVLTCGSRANDDLARSLAGQPGERYLVGDCAAPRRLIHAVLSGARVAATL